MRNAFDACSILYEGKWEGVGPWNREFFGPCEMASHLYCVLAFFYNPTPIQLNFIFRTCVVSCFLSGSGNHGHEVGISDPIFNVHISRYVPLAQLYNVDISEALSKNLALKTVFCCEGQKEQ